MDSATAHILTALTSDFYRQQAASFSQTRSAPWQGWYRCLDDLRKARRGAKLSLLDLACGNLRFEAFLRDELPDTELSVVACDDCDDLANSAAWFSDLADCVNYQHLDIVQLLADAGAFDCDVNARSELEICAQAVATALLGLPCDGVEAPSVSPRDAAKTAMRHDAVVADPHDAAMAGPRDAVSHDPNDAADAISYDAAVSFGFLHHVPGAAARAALLLALAQTLRPEGRLIVSLWRYMDESVAARKARVAHDRALEQLAATGRIVPTSFERALDPGDHLLGWKELPGVFRYCHSFSDEDIALLCAATEAHLCLLRRFRADGAQGRSNEYLVFERV